MSSKDALKYLLPGAVPYAMTKAAINAVKGKKKDAAKRPKPSKVEPKPSPKPSRSPKTTGRSSRKNKGAASERTGSNASKANTGRGNWI
jgi:hypothetical protein